MKLGPLTGTAWKQGEYWGCWVRLCGYGIAVSNMQMMFSERMGYTPCWQIGGAKVKLLRRERAVTG